MASPTSTYVSYPMTLQPGTATAGPSPSGPPQLLLPTNPTLPPTGQIYTGPCGQPEQKTLVGQGIQVMSCDPSEFAGIDICGPMALAPKMQVWVRPECQQTAVPVLTGVNVQPMDNGTVTATPSYSIVGRSEALPVTHNTPMYPAAPASVAPPNSAFFSRTGGAGPFFQSASVPLTQADIQRQQIAPPGDLVAMGSGLTDADRASIQSYLQRVPQPDEPPTWMVWNNDPNTNLVRSRSDGFDFPDKDRPLNTFNNSAQVDVLRKYREALKNFLSNALGYDTSQSAAEIRVRFNFPLDIHNATIRELESVILAGISLLDHDKVFWLRRTTTESPGLFDERFAEFRDTRDSRGEPLMDPILWDFAFSGPQTVRKAFRHDEYRHFSWFKNNGEREARRELAKNLQVFANGLQVSRFPDPQNPALQFVLQPNPQPFPAVDDDQGDLIQAVLVANILANLARALYSGYAFNTGLSLGPTATDPLISIPSPYASFIDQGNERLVKSATFKDYLRKFYEPSNPDQWIRLSDFLVKLAKERGYNFPPVPVTGPLPAAPGGPVTTTATTFAPFAQLSPPPSVVGLAPSRTPVTDRRLVPSAMRVANPNASFGGDGGFGAMAAMNREGGAGGDMREIAPGMFHHPFPMVGGGGLGSSDSRPLPLDDRVGGQSRRGKSKRSKSRKSSSGSSGSGRHGTQELMVGRLYPPTVLAGGKGSSSSGGARDAPPRKSERRIVRDAPASTSTSSRSSRHTSSSNKGRSSTTTTTSGGRKSVRAGGCGCGPKSRRDPLTEE